MLKEMPLIYKREMVKLVLSLETAIHYLRGYSGYDREIIIALIEAIANKKLGAINECEIDEMLDAIEQVTNNHGNRFT